MIIKHQRGRGNKIHLLLDDEYAVTTDVNFWMDHYISDGTDIDEDEWEHLLQEINYKKALNKCGDLLSRRDHSVKELKIKLLRTVDEKSADKAINRYLDAGYLDDEKYCRRLIEYLFNEKKYSKSHVRQECFKRGISSDIVNEKLQEFFDESDYSSEDAIIGIILNKYSAKLEKDDGKQKVIAVLMRKGFSYGDICSAFYRIENDEI
ncbi:MAG: recombination regulator RecX [Acetobacter sp.]|nr:recombination regulator RecX [Bacteroides sp.]MCM1340547.1 recombination regulator RecX [Acetobacter sp.]MCM1433287.1 recombination regulator RecX [Clostridiales bacterium]